MLVCFTIILRPTTAFGVLEKDLQQVLPWSKLHRARSFAVQLLTSVLAQWETPSQGFPLSCAAEVAPPLLLHSLSAARSLCLLFSRTITSTGSATMSEWTYVSARTRLTFSPCWVREQKPTSSWRLWCFPCLNAVWPHYNSWSGLTYGPVMP